MTRDPISSISVLITSYNYRDFVTEAVDSALAQTLPARQIVVVDDGSTDGTPDLLQQRYAGMPSVQLLPKRNEGQLAAFISGAQHCVGDIVCFLDADDCWGPDYLQQIAGLFAQRPDVDFVFSDMRLFGAEQQTMRYAPRSRDLGYTALSTYFHARWHGAPTSALCLRRAMLLRVLEASRDVMTTWRLCADACLVFGASLLGAKKHYLSTGAAYYRIHGGNGWWGKRSADAVYRNSMSTRTLIQHYAHRAGLEPGCATLAKAEFMTKPRPAWEDFREYAAIAWKAPVNPLKRLEWICSMLAHYLRRRRARALPAAATADAAPRRTPA